MKDTTRRLGFPGSILVLLLPMVGCDMTAGLDETGRDAVAAPDAPIDLPEESPMDIAPADIIPGSGDATPDVPDAGCECGTVDTCCDGCQRRAVGRRCDPGDGGWGLCVAGRCEPLAGTVDEWTPEGFDASAQAVAVSADGRHVAVALDQTDGEAGGTVLWDLEARRQVWSFAGDARDVAFQPASWDRVAVGAAPVAVRAMADGAVSLTIADATGPVAFSPDGTRLAASVGDDVVVVDAATGEVLHRLTHALESRSTRWTVAFSPDGTRLVSATGQSGLGSPHGDVRVFDLAGEEAPQVLTCPSMGAAFSPDGTRLAAACWHSVLVWDVATGAVVGQRYEGDSVLSVAWSPDGGTLATGTLGSGVRFYDANHLATESEALAVFPLMQAHAVAFDPLGRAFVAASWMGPSLYVWTWEAVWPALVEGDTP